MTMENAKNIAEAISFKIEERQRLSLPGVNELIDKIFNDHEEQLKAKESDLERQDMIIKCLNIDLENKEKLLKAKDEEIKELGEIVQQYLIPSKNYDAIIKAKDEEIDRLKGKTQILEVLVDNTKDIIEAQTRMCRTKARSIVAMLFWEWRKSEARIYATNIKWKTGRAFQSQILFEAAYKILKEQQ